MPQSVMPLLILCLLAFAAAMPACGGYLDPEEEVPLALEGDANAVAVLRGHGYEGLAAVAALRAQQPLLASAERWDALLDEVAQQRGARHAGLYWHTDLESARADAAATGRPIVSLRLLGRLTDEYSCANSRFFRTVLYADPAVAARLRSTVVLHWSSERPVPQVAIDFGGGRVLRTTLAGNSAHYVLDAQGRVIDALPGLYAPSEFLARLGVAVAVERESRVEAVRAFVLALYHNAGAARAAAASMPRGDDILIAESMTMSKSAVEIRPLRAIARAEASAPPLDEESLAALRDANPGWRAMSAESLALISAQLSELRSLPGYPGDAAVLDGFAQALAGDTAINEHALHPLVHQRLAADPEAGFDEVNRWMYAELFRTPASDPWLGLLPREYDGLERRVAVAAIRD